MGVVAPRESCCLFGDEQIFRIGQSIGLAVGSYRPVLSLEQNCNNGVIVNPQPSDCHSTVTLTVTDINLLNVANHRKKEPVQTIYV